MQQLASLIIPIIIVVAVALVIVVVAERFSPDPLITTLVKIIVFVGVLIILLEKLLPLLK